MAVVPAKRARLNRARASRDPVIHGRRERTNRFDYWIPALARRAMPGSLGRNDRQGCCGTTRSPVDRATCDYPAAHGERQHAEYAALLITLARNASCAITGLRSNVRTGAPRGAPVWTSTDF
jgi:hypothetical protein